MSSTTKQINLIPVETRFLVQWTLKRSAFLMVLAMIVGLVSVHLMQERTINNYATKIMESEKDFAALSAQQVEMMEIIGSSEKIIGQKDTLEVIRGILADYQNTSVYWSSVIGDIVENTGRAMWFENLEVYDDQKRLKDKTMSRTKRIDIGGRSFSQDSIAEFIGFMEGYSLFKEIVLVESVKEVYGERTVFRFLMTAEVRS